MTSATMGGRGPPFCVNFKGKPGPRPFGMLETAWLTVFAFV